MALPTWVSGSLRQTPGRSLDVADVLEGLPEFGEEVWFGEEGLDEIESGGKTVEIAQRVKNPITQLAGTHRG